MGIVASNFVSQLFNTVGKAQVLRIKARVVLVYNPIERDDQNDDDDEKRGGFEMTWTGFWIE